MTSSSFSSLEFNDEEILLRVFFFDAWLLSQKTLDLNSIDCHEQDFLLDWMKRKRKRKRDRLSRESIERMGQKLIIACTSSWLLSILSRHDCFQCNHRVIRFCLRNRIQLFKNAKIIFDRKKKRFFSDVSLKNNKNKVNREKNLIKIRSKSKIRWESRETTETKRKSIEGFFFFFFFFFCPFLSFETKRTEN